jgi:phage-related protein
MKYGLSTCRIFLVVLFNGFQKKSQKTSKIEIEKAMRLKDEYFKLKKQKK